MEKFFVILYNQLIIFIKISRSFYWSPTQQSMVSLFRCGFHSWFWVWTFLLITDRVDLSQLTNSDLFFLLKDKSIPALLRSLLFDQKTKCMYYV